VANHKTLRRLAEAERGKRKALGGWLLIALIILAVTFAKITTAYGEFWEEAFDAPFYVVLLALLNLLVGGGLIAGLIALVKPTQWLPYAVVVAMSLTSILAAPIAVSTFTGSDIPGKPESVKVSDLYSPLDKVVSAELGKAVTKKKVLKSRRLSRSTAPVANKTRGTCWRE